MPQIAANRGRSPTKHPYDFTESLVARPADIVKNIQKRPSSTASTFKLDRSRESSQQRVGLSRLPSANDTLTLGSNSSQLIRTTSSQLQHQHQHQHRLSRFKHPLSAYGDEAVDTVVPKHTSMLYQKYQAAEPKRPSLREDDWKKSLRRKSVALDDGLVPAFNDMTIDMDEEDKVHENDSGVSSIEDYDNRFPSSVTELKTQLEKSVSRPSTEKSDSSTGTSYTRQSSEHIGRIQQKLNHLRNLNIDNQVPNAKFSSIEQKILLESLNIEMQNLKRFGYYPLQDSLQRVCKVQQIKDPKKDKILIQSPKQPLIKSYNPLQAREELLYPLQSKSSIDSTPPVKREINLKKLKTLLKASPATLESLWEDYDDTNKPARQDSYFTNDSSIRTDSYGCFTPGQMDHTKFFKEQFEGYNMGKRVEKKRASIDPSPKTAP